MHLRDYEESDHTQLLSLTLATFQPFFEESFPECVNQDEELIAHQHGNWRGDYARQLPELLKAAGPCHTTVPRRVRSCSGTSSGARTPAQIMPTSSSWPSSRRLEATVLEPH